MGNTLLLKLANTISNREPALAAATINAAAAGAFTSNADDFEVPFGSSVGNQNPLYLYNFVTRQDDQMLSQTILDAMNAQDDPRLPIYFTPTPTPVTTGTSQVNNTGTLTNIPGPLVNGVPTPAVLTFTGFINGNGITPPSRPLGYRSRYNTYIRGVAGEAPARLLSNAQRLFILAESVLTLPGVTVTGQTAQTLYQAAIRASMTKAGIADAAISAYLTSHPDVATLSTTPLNAQRQIITQKWIASVGNGIEPYNDFRRTGFPALGTVLNASGDNGRIPLRFPYPLSELTANGGAENQDANIRTSVKVWWGL